MQLRRAACEALLVAWLPGAGIAQGVDPTNSDLHAIAVRVVEDGSHRTLWARDVADLKRQLREQGAAGIVMLCTSDGTGDPSCHDTNGLGALGREDFDWLSEPDIPGLRWLRVDGLGSAPDGSGREARARARPLSGAAGAPRSRLRTRASGG
jgi:hypothetical protein